MTFLGILLILVGVGIIFSGAIVVGLIPIALGFICFAAKKDKKTAEKQAVKEEKAKKEAISKEEWILEQTAKYMDRGMSPTDAKVKAEVDYMKNKNKNSKPRVEDILDENGMWTCSCGHKNYDNQIFCTKCLKDRKD